ncbi:PRMT5-domain-containing protein [Ramaria rubella]|nr:PRMT5-domain-containing protein [Ramaria rubella]
MQFDFKAPSAIYHPLCDIPPHDGSSEKSPVQTLLADAQAKAYNCICIPLTNENWRARWREMCIPNRSQASNTLLVQQHAEAWRDGAGFKREEVLLNRLDESDGVIGLISDWLELDSPDHWIRHDSEIALLQELSYASYINVQTVILPPPRNRTHIGSYARAVNAALSSTSSMQISIRIPLYGPTVISSNSPSFVQATTPGVPLGMLSPHLHVPDGDLSDTWEMWDSIRNICAYHPRLSLTLDLTPPCPPNARLLERWTAEPTRHLFLPATTFIPNPKGYPVLPKSTQSFIREIVTQRPTIILSGTQASLHTSGGEGAYLQYIRHLEKTSPGIKASETEGTVENFARGYQDYLQAPLQPLMDNLQSITYEMFEKDPVKYAQYEKAVYLALCDRPFDSRTVICVVGAGRGPLVAGCLRATQKSGRSVEIYAVEKNPNAFVTLQERKEFEWNKNVKIFYGDMRTLELPEQADILVSELLGSFGDNELSPECLDGAMRFLKLDGISIPSSYTAHLAPLSSSKLFCEVQSNSKDEKMAETPYVVMFHAVNLLSGDGGGPQNRCGTRIQECWAFEHPRKDAVLDARGLPLTNSHNVRSAQLRFYIPHAGALHGLAGYFEAVLYRDVGLSIHPDRKDLISRNMLSWFPLFFPLKEPLYLPANSELHVSIWRLTDKRKVWYEWSAESFLAIPRIRSEDFASLLSPPVQHTNGTAGGFEGIRPHIFSPRAGSPASALSPMLDGPQPLWDKNGAIVDSELTCVVKIGQTSLHNPGGRSSWIGL